MEKLRAALRLLLPSPIRRPLADQFYWFLAQAKWAYYRVVMLLSLIARSWATISPGVERRKRIRGLFRGLDFAMLRGLPVSRFAYRVAAMLYASLRAKFASYWLRVNTFRYLLGADPRTLSLWSRFQRMVVVAFLALPDWRYRRRYISFAEVLAKLPREAVSLPRSGIVLMIGALGPGGAERQAVLTLAGFAKRGYGPLRLICSFLRHEAQRFFLPHLESVGVPVAELERGSSRDVMAEEDWPLVQAIQRLPWSLRDVADYMRAFSTYHPSVVHLWLDEVNIKGGLAAVATGVPRIVLGLRSLPPCHFALHQPYMREGYRWLAKQPSVVLLNNSAAGARAYEEWLGLQKGTIRVVRNGFDFDMAILSRYCADRGGYRMRHNISSVAPLVGTVIRLSEEKRPLLWLEIAAAVRQELPQAKFLVVGDGPLRGDMEARAACEDLWGAVYFVGHEQEAFAAIAAMDIFLLTSRAEGLPNVLVEAQALGVPVVTTNVGGAPETVKHGLTGWVLDRDDIWHASEVIVKLLRDLTWRSRASKEAPSFVRSVFGVERMLDETIATYGMGSNELILSELNGVCDEPSSRATV